MTLSRREILLILGLALLAVGASVYFLFSQLNGYEARLAREAARKKVQLGKTVELTQQLLGFSSKPSRRRRRKPLIGNVEQLASRAGLKDRIQLNLVPTDKAKDVEGIDVKLDNLTLDEMVAFLHAIEGAVPPLVVAQVDITNAFRSQEHLRLSVRILAKK